MLKSAILPVALMTLGACATRDGVDDAYAACKGRGDAVAQSDCIDERLEEARADKLEDALRRDALLKRQEQARGRAEASGAPDRAYYADPDDIATGPDS